MLGLTTAAGLWAAACVGLAIGIGFYEGAIAGGITIFCAMTIFHKMNDFMRKNSKRLNLYLEIDNSECLGLFLKTLKENGMNVANMQFIKSKGPPPKTTNVFLSIDIRKSQTHKSILLELQKEKGVILLQEL